MEWLVGIAIFVVAVYLFLGVLVIMWGLGMARHAPIRWYHLVWLVVTWPRVFKE